MWIEQPRKKVRSRYLDGKRLCPGFLLFETAIFTPMARLEHRDALPECLLELEKAGLVEILFVDLLDTVDVRAESFSEKDCGKYLHSCSLRWSHNFASRHSVSW